jgi:hypothetical protein
MRHAALTGRIDGTMTDCMHHLPMTMRATSAGSPAQRRQLTSGWKWRRIWRA